MNTKRKKTKKFLGYTIEPGWHFSLIEPLLDKGFFGRIAWAILFFALTPLILPMTILAWALNPPWKDYEDW
jgi:hypothetical protein